MNPEETFPSIRQDGIKHGQEIWRPDPKEIEIKNPYPGSTPEGAAFYLGVAIGLEKASIGHHLPK